MANTARPHVINSNYWISKYIEFRPISYCWLFSSILSSSWGFLFCRGLKLDANFNSVVSIYTYTYRYLREKIIQESTNHHTSLLHRKLCMLKALTLNISGRLYLSNSNSKYETFLHFQEVKWKLYHNTERIRKISWVSHFAFDQSDKGRKNFDWRVQRVSVFRIFIKIQQRGKCLLRKQSTYTNTT